ncbi:hypothetical protein [Streptomyces sp. BK205]|uniref:hypothetical protein n=1 Tax=Streptomyces sp. BK205 TaxID=2512164 RepID=UPI0010EACAB2|nr:hypothetical protein [Streptomyces sp. BK205]TCR17658.1 hypothetical protein EV578_111118 [Streptomyces sp. BK205]
MAVDQLPGQVRDFVAYLSGVLARLDQGGGWCAVFWQRDPDGMQACLDGREVPPWDVVEALLQDLAGAYGLDAARAEAERARPLHAAAQSAHDARPGGRDALGDRFDVMLREQRYAAERQAELGRLLAAAATQEEADALRLDLAWARDDHERAVRRCAELQSRMAELDRRTMGDRADAARRGRLEGAGFFRRGRTGDTAAFGEGEPGAALSGTGHGERIWADGRQSGGSGPHAHEGEATSGRGGEGPGSSGHGGPGDGAWGDGRESGGSGAHGHGYQGEEEGGSGHGESGDRGWGDAPMSEGSPTDGRGQGDDWSGGHSARTPSAGAGRPGAPATGFPAMPQQRGTAVAAADTPYAGQRPATGPAAPSATGPGPAEGPHPGYGPQPTAPGETLRPGNGTPYPNSPDAFDRAYAPQQTSTGTAAPDRAYAPQQTSTGTAAPDRDPLTDAQPDTPPEAPPTAKQRKRRRGGARFAGEADAEVGPVVVPPTAVPDLPAEPAKRGRTPRGARFAGAADTTDVRQPGRMRAQKASGGAEDAAAPRETADTVATLVRLRAEGRTGEAHALLVEVAHWPAARFPLLAAELQRAGLGADWATLLWEAASLPAEQLVAAADALVAAGRGADGEQMLRQGVARPAGEIGAAVLALLGEGRRREASALLDAYVRVRTPEEAARSAEPDPRTLVPLLLTAARAVSQERHWDLVHALRVAGFSA